MSLVLLSSSVVLVDAQTTLPVRPSGQDAPVLTTNQMPEDTALLDAVRQRVDPAQMRYQLPDDFQPYTDEGVNLAPASPGLQASSPVAATGLVTAVVFFEGTSALEQVQPRNLPRNATELSAVNQTASMVRAGQATILNTLRTTHNAQVVTQLSHVTNGAVINVDASQIAAIEALPDVREVILDEYGELTHANSVPLIGAPIAWDNGAGIAGDGLDIGIIDSGIDYLHTNFGGSGSGYESADTTTLDGSEFNSKVVGGADYVGDGWEAGDALVFDEDPWDCNGHGSHVAGTAGGSGVANDGTAYTGPYNSSVDLSTLRVAPGVAPEARLHALKIGDCTPSVSFAAAISAIDNYVIPNGLDVVNNSYGGPFGSAQEPLVDAYERATAAGIVMVGSAGNSGDTYFINGNPNIANSAISVASSVSNATYQGIIVDDIGANTSSTVPASASVNGALADPTIGPLDVLPVPGTGGCTASDYDSFNGEVGVIRWDDGTCGSVTRMTNAVNNGNVGGLVVITTDPDDAPFIRLNCGFDNGSEVVVSSLACVSLQSSADNLYTNPTNFQVTFDNSLTAQLADDYSDLLSGFTSRGPRMSAGDTIRLKPDVAAPGDAIFSAAAGTGTEGTTLGGTSMAAPHVAGMATLLRQLYPSYTPQQIKALIMNTATNDLWTDINQTGDNYGPSRVGNGRVDVGNALQHEAIAYSTENPAGVHVSFGRIDAVSNGFVTQTITIEDTSGNGGTYSVGYEAYLDMRGANVTISPTSVNVPANGSATVEVRLNYVPSLMDEDSLVDPTMSETQDTGFGTLPRAWLREESGYVTFSGGATDLRVAVHAMPRPTAERVIATPPQMSGTTGSTTLDITGTGVDTSGTLTPDQYSVTSLVSAFNAVVTLPNDALTGPAEDRGDIQHVGITSDYQAQLAAANDDVATAIDNTTIYIGFSTYAPWTTPQPFDVLYDFYFDPEEDGTFPVNVFNWDGAALFGLDSTDTPFNLLYVNGSFGGSGTPVNAALASTDTYTFNNNVVMVPIPASWLGLSDTNTDFDFDFGTLVELGPYVDFTPTISYDVAADEIYNFNDTGGNVGGPYTGSPTWFDVPSVDVPVDYDFSALSDPALAPPILLLHHHNGSPQTRAELVFPNASELLTNGNFSDGRTDWSLFGDYVFQANGEVLSFFRKNPGWRGAVLFQTIDEVLPANAPLEVSVMLGNTGNTPKTVEVTLREANYQDSLTCAVTIPANAPMQPITMRGTTSIEWSSAVFAIRVHNQDNTPAVKVDDASVQYTPGSGPFPYSCTGYDVVPDENVLRNADFSTQFLREWVMFGDYAFTVDGDTLAFNRTASATQAAVALQFAGSQFDAGMPVRGQIDIGNTSNADKDVTVILRDSLWADSLICSFTVPANTAPTTVTVEGITSDPWGLSVMQIRLTAGDNQPALVLDNASLAYVPSSDVMATTCSPSIFSNDVRPLDEGEKAPIRIVPDAGPQPDGGGAAPAPIAPPNPGGLPEIPGF